MLPSPRTKRDREARRLHRVSRCSASGWRRTGHSSTGCASVSRDTSAGSSIGSGRWERTSSREASSTPRRPHARWGSARRRSTSAPARVHGDVRDVVPGPPRRAGRRRARRRPQPSTDAQPRLRGDDDRRVARQLLRVLRPGDRGRPDTGRDSLQDGHGDAARRRSRVGRPARVARRRARRARPPHGAHRLPRPHVSRNARHVLRLHAGARADECARRGARDRRSRRPRRVGRDRGDREEGTRDQGGLRSGGRRNRPDRRRDHARGLRLVGARRRRASIDSSRTSSSTGSRTTTAASATISPSA